MQPTSGGWIDKRTDRWLETIQRRRLKKRTAITNA